MRYTPVELRHVRISRGFFGYRRDETNRMLEDVADSFEEVWSERGELVDKLEETEKQLADFKEREVLLANTLISAEKAATDAKELARREAELILSEAHQEARSITRTALAQREHLFAEARRVETLLRSALGIVEESSAEKQAADGCRSPPRPPGGPDEHWPKREDTREFQLPLAQSAAELQAEAAGCGARAGARCGGRGAACRRGERRQAAAAAACRPPPKRPRSTVPGQAGTSPGGSLRERERDRDRRVPQAARGRARTPRGRGRVPARRERRRAWRTTSARSAAAAPTTTSRTRPATAYDRELDQGLEEGAQQTLDEIDAALARIDDGTYGTCESCGKPIGEARLQRDPVGAALHRRPAARRLSEPQQVRDVRVGSSTDGLTPLSVAERSLAAGAWQWAGLATVALAAVIADQVTKHVVTSTLALDDSVHVVGPLSIHHVQNSGIAFGLFAGATAVVTFVTAAAVVWMVVFFARSGARHPVLPAALGLLVGGSLSNLVDRIRLHHVTDFIDLGWWPAFNLADSFIVIGVAILLGGLVAADRKPRPPRRTLDVAAR